MYLDLLTKARLEWLLDNEPELVSNLLQANNLTKLEEMLEAKVVEAVRYAEVLQDHGRSNQEALDLASELILTPADGRDMSDNPPKPLPNPVRKEIYRRLEARDRAREQKNLRLAK